jgi:hypothetical protein
MLRSAMSALGATRLSVPIGSGCLAGWLDLKNDMVVP